MKDPISKEKAYDKWRNALPCKPTTATLWDAFQAGWDAKQPSEPAGTLVGWVDPADGSLIATHGRETGGSAYPDQEPPKDWIPLYVPANLESLWLTKVATLICPRCGVDRYKEGCPVHQAPNCPMVGDTCLSTKKAGK